MSIAKNLNRVLRLTDHVPLRQLPRVHSLVAIRAQGKGSGSQALGRAVFQGRGRLLRHRIEHRWICAFLRQEASEYARLFVRAEPDELGCDLDYNAYLNGLSDRLSAFCVAVSEHSGVGTFRFRNEASLHIAGYAESVLDSETERSSESIRWKSKWVQLINLDSFVANSALPVPTHVKIDVDGHEFDVLQGMRDLLQRGELKSLLIELDQDDTKIDLLLLDAGFERRQLHGVWNTARLLAIENRLYVRGL